MIEQIKLKQYQAHESTDVEFTAGLNVIVGSSDHGKSSIIRALLTVIQNSPVGEGLITHGHKEFEVVVEADGMMVGRSRQGKTNIYSLGDQEFKAFGREVPVPVREHLNIADVNIQRQHDPIFMLPESGGEVARRLNKTVNLEKIDAATKEVASRSKACNRRLKETQGQISVLDVELSKLDWIDEAQVVVNELSGIEVRISRRSRVRDNLISILDAVDAIELSDYDWIVGAEHAISKAQTMRDKCSDLDMQFKSLSPIVTGLEAIESRDFGWLDRAVVDIDGASEMEVKLRQREDRVWKLNNLIGELEVVERDIELMSYLDGAEALIDTAIKVAEIVEEGRDKRRRLDRLLTDIGDVGGLIEDATGEIEGGEKELARLMPDVCPLCGEAHGGRHE